MHLFPPLDAKNISPVTFSWPQDNTKKIIIEGPQKNLGLEENFKIFSNCFDLI